MADASVRPARLDDAAELGRIQVDTWRTAYRELLPAPALAGLDPDTAAQAWSAAIATPPSPRHRVLVATEGDWLVGFAAVGPADPDDDDPAAADPRSEGSGSADIATTVALGPLLVEPRWGRRGHGSRLLAAAVDHARADGMTRMVTWIPEGDRVTRDFLVSAGWAPEGLARALDTGAGELREIRLHSLLGDEATA